MTYRTVHDMSADELLDQLERGRHYGEENAVKQIALFVRMGGNPNDHDYARLSFRTRELRDRGIDIKSSRTKGLWL